MKKVRTPIAATIFLLIPVVLSLVQTIERMEYYITYGLYFGYPDWVVSDVLTCVNQLVLLALCCALFAKKRNNVTIVLLGINTLIAAVNLIWYFRISTALHFLCYALLTIHALVTFKQTIIKKDLSKVTGLCSNAYFLPTILFAIASLISLSSTTISYIEHLGFDEFNYYYDVYILEIIYLLLPNAIKYLLRAIALLFIGKWIKDPYVKEDVPQGTNEDIALAEYNEAYCSLGKHIVLCLFTFGIWYLIWIYRTTKYLNKTPNAEYYNPTSKLLLCMFVPFYQIYWFYKHGQRIDTMTEQKKLTHSDMATTCLILGIFIPIVACILMQDRINILCTTKLQRTDDSATEQLRKYKELLDENVITQEEFDAKKKQLLEL